MARGNRLRGRPARGSAAPRRRNDPAGRPVETWVPTDILNRPATPRIRGTTHWSTSMAIEVRIPTILRTYTGGAKAVEGAGATLGDLLGDLDSRHAGLRDRLVDDAGLRRFVNVYLNDEDVRFLGGLTATVKDGDTVTVLPAVAGGTH